MDALDNLRAFVATAEAGSFSQAARQLGLVPSTRPKRASTLPSAHGQSRTDRCRTIRYVASSAACVRHPHTWSAAQCRKRRRNCSTMTAWCLPPPACPENSWAPKAWWASRSCPDSRPTMQWRCAGPRWPVRELRCSPTIWSPLICAAAHWSRYCPSCTRPISGSRPWYQAAASNCHAFRPCCADCKDNSRCRRYRNRCPICTPRAIQKSHPSTPGRSARGCDAVTWHRRMHGGSETERLRKRPGLFRPDRFGDLRIQLDQALVAGCRLYRQIQPESA